MIIKSGKPKNAEKLPSSTTKPLEVMEMNLSLSSMTLSLYPPELITVFANVAG
jgi:hypothetical protein